MTTRGHLGQPYTVVALTFVGISVAERNLKHKLI